MHFDFLVQTNVQEDYIGNNQSLGSSGQEWRERSECCTTTKLTDRHRNLSPWSDLMDALSGSYSVSWEWLMFGTFLLAQSLLVAHILLSGSRCCHCSHMCICNCRPDLVPSLPVVVLSVLVRETEEETKRVPCRKVELNYQLDVARWHAFGLANRLVQV